MTRHEKDDLMTTLEQLSVLWAEASPAERAVFLRAAFTDDDPAQHDPFCMCATCLADLAARHRGAQPTVRMN